MSYIFNNSLFPQRVCTGTDFGTWECWNKLYCPQIHTPIINFGIGLIIANIVFNIIANRWLNDKSIEIAGIDFDIGTFVLDTLNNVMMLYILLIVYINL